MPEELGGLPKWQSAYLHLVLLPVPRMSSLLFLPDKFYFVLQNQFKCRLLCEITQITSHNIMSSPPLYTLKIHLLRLCVAVYKTKKMTQIQGCQTFLLVASLIKEYMAAGLAIGNVFHSQYLRTSVLQAVCFHQNYLFCVQSSAQALRGPTWDVSAAWKTFGVSPSVPPLQKIPHKISFVIDNPKCKCLSQKILLFLHSYFELGILLQFLSQ